MADAKTKRKKLKVYSVNQRSKDYFTQNLAVMLRASVPIGRALQSFSKTSKSRNLRKTVDQIIIHIDEGFSLHDSLKDLKLVSKSTLALIDLGEKSGNLADNLEVAVGQEQKQRKFRSKVRSALIYPAFVLSMTLIIGIAVAWFLLPKLTNTFARLDSDVPLITTIMLNIGTFLEANGIWFVPLLLVAIMLMVYVLFFMPGTRRIGQYMLLHTPGIGRLLKEVEIARFGYLLGTLLQSGLSITQALGMMTRASTLRASRQFYEYLREGFENGYSFESSFERYKKSGKLLPPEVQQIIIAGEISGSLPETLMHIGNNYEERADNTAQNLETILEPVLLLIVWAGVLLVAVAVILPIYSLVGGLGG